ncbi:MAG: serine hydrolase domain-containing protein [Candidatus Saccharicenans sp.]|nr:serine hydrolase domain-containing protein [Candidatus Saccharicenans sp.]
MIKNMKDFSSLSQKHQSVIQRKLDQLLASLIGSAGIKEAIASIETGDGLFRWLGAAGSPPATDKQQITNIPFFIASVTKLFITASILRLQEMKLLGLDQPASLYLPEGFLTGLLRTRDGRDLTSEITIAQLLSHTSGLPDYLEMKDDRGKSLVDRIIKEEDQSFTIQDFLEIVRKCGKPIRPVQRVSPISFRAYYADTNFQILFAVLENVCNRTIKQVFTDLIYTPLGIKSTFLPGPATSRRDLFEAFPVRAGDKILNRPMALRSFGDLYSTISELNIFMRSLINGQLFNNPETARLMTSGWKRFGFRFSSFSPGWPIEYGLGIMRFKPPAFLGPFRRLPAVIGHTGAVGSWLFYCPGLDLYMAGTVNQLKAAAIPFRFVMKVLNFLYSLK